MPRSVVLGANGFIGSHLSEHLARLGHNVIGFDLFRSRPVFPENVEPGRIAIVKGDFLNSEDLEKVLKGADYVFHFASMSVPYDETTPNAECQSSGKALSGAIQLFELCVKHGIKKVIFPSSGGLIYGRKGERIDKVTESEHAEPEMPHGIVKHAVEMCLEYFHMSKQLDYCVLRMSNVYGPRGPVAGSQGVISIFMNALFRGQKPVIYGDGHTVRDYVFVEDTVRAIGLAASKQLPRKIYNVGSGKGYSTLEILRKIEVVCGRSLSPVFLPERALNIRRIVLDCQEFRHDVGWEPKIEIDTGLKRVLSWMDVESSVKSPVIHQTNAGL